MIKIKSIEELNVNDMYQLYNKILPVLEKRKALHERYSRNATDSNLMYPLNNEETVVTFEKFITDLATGYLSGKPQYNVKDTYDEDKVKIIKKLLKKPKKDKNYKKTMEILIDYITGYNDDSTENHDLIHDINELTSCYEILYENENNEIVYSRYNPLETVAIWDYSIPSNLIGLVRVWEEKDINDKIYPMFEITDKNGTRTYNVLEDKKEVEEVDNQNHDWGDVPAIAVENDYAIFEPCEAIIKAYEQLVQNTRNTYQYNDEAKLKVTGYAPKEPLLINKDGQLIENPNRQKEDETLLKMKVFYTPDKDGDIEWIIKNIDANGVESMLKMYSDLVFQLAGIPNTSDLAFNSADLNASAIDRKFYIMNMATAGTIAQLKKAYQRRWELIFNRINLKNNTNFDFRDIEIELPKNLPANDDEKIDSTLKLQGVVSDQTLIEKLGFDYVNEKNRMEQESEDNFNANLQNIQNINKNQENTNDMQEAKNDEKIEEEIKQEETE